MHLASGDPSGAGVQRREADRAEIERELMEYVAHQPASRRTTPWLHSQVMRYLLADVCFARWVELCRRRNSVQRDS